MAPFSLKVSRKEKRSVICFLWPKGLGTNAIHTEINAVYGEWRQVFWDQQYMFG